MKYRIAARQSILSGTIPLPSSKSISNRVLIINALCYNPYSVNNLSDSDDTRVLTDALNSNRNVFDIGHAGTAMRFLTAFLSKIAGEWVVTGSQRMKERPIVILVDALNQMGARITYMEKEGFPPLHILGSHLKGGSITLNGSVSSQYISALLMIAPTVEQGLSITLKGEVTSRSYLELTMDLMAQFGIQYRWEGATITIPEQHYLPRAFTVEADWSGASYWYQALALAERGELFLENLRLESRQGDSKLALWFRPFGIRSEQRPNGVLISKEHREKPGNVELDFMENPDIAQTFAALCVAEEIPFHFYGLKTLKIKETDRIAALQNELRKLGAMVMEPAEGELAWDGTINRSAMEEIPLIKTYHDHRMALSFAPLALAGRTVEIDDPMVVTKSYPTFWDDLRKCGFEIRELA